MSFVRGGTMLLPAGLNLPQKQVGEEDHHLHEKT